MKHSMSRIAVSFLIAGASGCLTMAAAQAKDAGITVNVGQPGAKVSPMLWGIFFEDINCSADGGIYAELVRNRSFEDSEKPDRWSVVDGPQMKADIRVDTEKPMSPKNPHSLKVAISGAGDARAGVANDGFWGIALKKDAVYNLSLNVRAAEGFSGPLTLSLESADGTTCYAKETLARVGADWQAFKFALTSTGTDPKARLVISANKPGAFWLDMVSLFPKDTWKGHGLRPDLCEMLAGLRPAFVRFPGGCWVEGDTMKLAYRWKQTIGDISERRTQHNIWNYEATHGLGFHEYLQLCEDLGAEPLFVINCGMSHREVVPMDKMQEFVQDALDAIEYCNGRADSTWGAVRAKNGHPAPFNLKYMEIGNENGGPNYQERYALFHDAIKAKHPDITLVANVPTDQRRPEVVDEHYYDKPEFFMQQAGRYDAYKRDGAKIYVGEYAVTQNCGQGNLRGAVGEAAFMTGMERNSDVVTMSSYAPLFVNVNHRGWNPDLIDFDSYRVYGIPSYYVQKMFSENRGDVVLPVTLDAPSEIDPASVRGKIGVGTWMTQAEFKDIKVTSGDKTLFSCDFADGAKDWKMLSGDWKAEGGALRQNGRAENCRAVAGDKTWTDYTYTLKARKTGGEEGFLILFRVGDESRKSWWNIGGWGNSRHAIELGGVSENSVPGKIETGRWYDIRVEVKGPSIKCYLDGQLIHDAKYPEMKHLYASATLAKAGGEVILKVANVSSTARTTDIKLNGVGNLTSPATAIVLTSGNPSDENSLDNPTKVAPVTEKIATSGTGFRHTFPGNSVTVLRLKVKQ